MAWGDQRTPGLPGHPISGARTLGVKLQLHAKAAEITQITNRGVGGGIESNSYRCLKLPSRSTGRKHTYVQQFTRHKSHRRQLTDISEKRSRTTDIQYYATCTIKPAPTQLATAITKTPWASDENKMRYASPRGVATPSGSRCLCG